MLHRVGIKRTDKLMVGNIDTGKADYMDVAEILEALDADDLAESANRVWLTPALKTKLENLSASNYTLAQLQGYFYPKDTNPSGYLTAASALDAAKLSGMIAAALIPGLDASKITAGILAAARIPDLDASKITTGTLSIDRIPLIPASKLEDFALTLSDYILKTAIGAANGVTPLGADIKVPTGYIPGLDAGKIISGILAEERIPAIYAKIADIVDNLTSTDPNVPASANQLRVLNEKIDGLAGSKYLGSYPSFEALTFEYPEGAGQDWHNNQGGWKAEVDLGVGEDVANYSFDLSDLKWVRGLGTSDLETSLTVKQKYEANPDTNAYSDAEKAKLAAIEAGATADQTGAEIKALYEAEPDTNAFTDALLSKLNSITEIFTTALKTSYDAAATWVSTNGQNVLDRLTALESKKEKEFAISDETTAFVADPATPIFSYRFLVAFTGMKIPLLQVIGAPTGSKLEVDVHKNGVSIFSTTLTVDIGEYLSINADVPAVMTAATIDWAVGDLMEVFVLDPGSTDAAFGGKMLIKNY